MSLMDKLKSIFSGGSSTAEHDHSDHDHSHDGHDHSHDAMDDMPAAAPMDSPDAAPGEDRSA